MNAEVSVTADNHAATVHVCVNVSGVSVVVSVAVEIKVNETDRIENAMVLEWQRTGDECIVEDVLRIGLGLIVGCVRRKNVPEMFIDDAIQVGRLALVEAMRCFKSSKKLNFTSFAWIVIERRVCTELYRLRHQTPLNVVTLEWEEDDEREVQPPSNDDVFRSVATRSDLLRACESLAADIAELPQQDRKCLVYRLRGYSYRETADALRLTFKQVDNSLQKSFRESAGLRELAKHASALDDDMLEILAPGSTQIERGAFQSTGSQRHLGGKQNQSYWTPERRRIHSKKMSAVRLQYEARLTAARTPTSIEPI